MKTKFLNFFKAALFSMAVLSFVSCEETTDEDDGDEVLVEDGFYVVGGGTALAELDPKGLMAVTRNEVLQENKAELKELYIAIKAGAEGFNIVQVSGTTKKTWGPGADFALVDSTMLKQDEPTKAPFWRGSLAETTNKFTVPEDGLYHVVIDTEVGKIVVARVLWGVIGAATPDGWSSSTPLPLSGGFNMNTMKFEIAEIKMLENEYKFRYSNGWKIILDTAKDLGSGKKGIKVNTNFGGTVSALVPGGDNMKNDKYGIYKVSMTWTLGAAYQAEITFVKDAEPLPTYPDAVYVVGDATAYGWDEPGSKAGAVMHKCAGGAPSEGIYWKICHIEASKGFKIAAAKWAAPNLGYTDVKEYDATGIAVSEKDGNMSVATSGMYIVVLNLRDNTVKVSVKDAEVYGIGDAFGSWDEAKAANKFTVNNTDKTLVSPALTAAANIRMYAEHSWIPAWWNAEFIVKSDKIEYRNDGGDQEAVAGTVGQVITLKFDDNTGTIK